MNVIKFNKFERVAGLFVLVALVGVFLTALSVALKQGWFERKIHYFTYFENADGLHQGTLVEIAGLKAGAVDSVELQGNHKIKVGFYILGKFQERVRENSSVQLIRPFIIGERVLDVEVGDENSTVLTENTTLASHESIDLMTLVSGKNINNSFNKVSDLINSVRAFIEPLAKNMNTMSVEVVKITQQANQNNSISKILNNAVTLTNELSRLLPEINRENPTLAKDLAILIGNLSHATQTLAPAMKGIEADLPQASRRMVEVLNETAVVLKAMQKSFLMKGNADQVRDEERLDSLKRMPAKENKIGQ